MFPQGRKQITALLILLGFLMMNVPAATAGGGGPLPKQAVGVAHENGEAFFSWAWSWMRSLLEKNGPCIDPNGACAPSGALIQPKAGPCIDPDGRCMPNGASNNLDHGPCIEPNGGCVASSSSG
jgi:hypothetical protein